MEGNMAITNNNTPKHIPVMVDPVMNALAPIEKGTYIDGTFGAGGYTKRILSKAHRVIAFDRDPDAILRGDALKKEYGDRLILIHGTYGSMDEEIKKRKLDPVHGVVLDLGVSSPQLDEALRGFSFQKEGPLDMRMSKAGRTAADVVNTLPERELAHILWTYGDESKSRAIARAIAGRRAAAPLKTTTDLAECVYSVCGRKKPHEKTDPATKTFQAIRIYINDEMEELRRGLEAAKEILAPNGKLVVVTFHSLEDRIVKNFIRNNSHNRPRVSRYASSLLDTSASDDVVFVDFSKKAILPSQEEVDQNPRARSAQLRWAIKGNPS
jgi:16S rRNA (cytosine1402-N4)-methyltransferase